MVWGLFPLESLPGANKYYIFSKGTYTVGRKDCDVIIQTDRAVSRVHAEIVVDVMTPTPQGSSRNSPFGDCPNVRVRDLSKFGTFIINKDVENQAVNTLPNKEAPLKEGDLITFGTGIATFRFCFVPLIAFVDSSQPLAAKHSLDGAVSSLGAQVTHCWSSECTHMIVDEFTSVTEDFVCAVMAQKPVVYASWFMSLAEKNIRTEMPSYSLHLPSVMLCGMSVKVVEPTARESSLKGYTFVLGQSHLYKLGSKLPLLIQVVGGSILHVDEFSPSSQVSMDVNKKQIALVIAEGSESDFDNFKNLRALHRIKDTQLVAAILSGNLDSSTLEIHSVVVSSSHSTDETIVAESDLENDTAISSHFAAPTIGNAIKLEDEKNLEKGGSKEVVDDSQTGLPEKTEIANFKLQDTIIMSRRKEETEDSSHQNSDVIYSQTLIVRDLPLPASDRLASQEKIPNFKHFRKRETVSGNSFKNLIPFSKEPYHESDYERKEVAGYLREEKRRKQMEAIADDLFNSEKARKRGTAGFSIHSLLVRQ